MRIANEIEISTALDGITHSENGIYLMITPEKRMDEIFFVPWAIAYKTADDIQAVRMDEQV